METKAKLAFAFMLILGFVLTSNASSGSCWMFPSSRQRRSEEGVDSGLTDKGETGASSTNKDSHVGHTLVWNPVAILDNSLKEMDREFREMEQNLNSFFKNVGFTRWHFGDTGLETGLKSQIVETEGDKNKYLMNVYLGDDFKPENVNLTLKDHIVTVVAKNNETSKDGHSKFYQEVIRRFTLPEKVEVDNMKSVFNPDGILRVEAPIPKDAKDDTEHAQQVEQVQPPQPQEIPINKIK